MKRIFTNPLLIAALSFAWGGTFAATHVIDVSTGIDNNTSQLIAIYTTPDDNWTVKKPNGSVFLPTHCGTGIPTASWTTPYAGKDPNVRWICHKDYLVPTGQHDNNAPGGIFEYKMTFELEPCEVQSAQFNFDHIGGDNEIIEILVNGNPYTVSYSFSPFSNNVTLPISAGDIIAGTNTIIVRVDNEGPTTYTGMEINGDLTIVDNSASSSFWLTYNNGVLQGHGIEGGEHQWNIYCTPNGNSGPYTLVATYSSPSFSMEGNCECYFITHTSSNECGEQCDAQSICNFECGEMECALSAPTGLDMTHVNATHDQFYWNPVPGAVSYVLVLTLGDPACCGTQGGPAQQAPPVVTFPVSYNFEVVDLSQLPWQLIVDGEPYCYSWYVYAVCADGSTSMASEVKCSSTSGGGGIPDERPGSSGSGQPDRNNATHTTGSGFGTAGIDNGRTSLSIYPNPVSDQVTFDIHTALDGEVDITVTDMTGKTVQSFNRLQASGGKLVLRWDAGSLGKGVYLVQVMTADREVTTQTMAIE